jgi:hypothetical protein
MSGSVQAEDTDCRPPNCISGKRSTEGGKLYIEVEVDHEQRDLKALSKATLLPPEIKLRDIDDGVFRGFTGCKNVTISGNPTITGGDVYTTDSQSKIEISGPSAEIDSNVLSAGALDGDHLDNITGNEILITEDVFLIESPDKWKIHEDVGRIYINGNLETKEGKTKNTELTIPSSLFVNGYAIFRVTTSIDDQLKVSRSLTASPEVGYIHFPDAPPEEGDIEYGGDCTDHSDSDLCSGGSSDVTISLPHLGVCDPIGLDGFFSPFSSKDGLEDWTLDGDTSTELTPAGFSPESDGDPEVADGYVKVKNFVLKGDLTVRDGPVVIHVIGDFSMAGGGASLNVKDGTDGDEDATLTLMVEGDFTFSGSGTIASDSAVVTVGEKSRPQMLVVVDGGDLRITGNGSMRGSIYAPKSDVEIKGNPSITGSVRGEALRVTGNPTLTYDDEDDSDSIGDIDQIVGVKKGTKPFIVD